MDLDSGLLRAFVDVVDVGHVGRAADRLHLTQQALSKRIARLEGLLGVRLLDRTPSGVVPTAAGVRLVAAARLAVDAVDGAVATVRGVEHLIVDVLDEHLSVLPAVRACAAAAVGPEVVATARGDGASVGLTLRRGRADVALGRPGPVTGLRTGELTGSALFAEPLCLLVPSSSRLAPDGVIGLTELRDHPLWFPTVGAPAEWTDVLTGLVRDHGLSVDSAGSTFGFDHWVARVADGSAPPSVVGAAMTVPAGLPVRVVAIVEPRPVFWWWAVWRRRLPIDAVTTLLTALSAHLGVGTTAGRVARPDPVSDWIPAGDRPFLTD